MDNDSAPRFNKNTHKSMEKKEYEKSSRMIGQVMNKAPASIQITAEQLLREANDRAQGEHKAPIRRIHDGEELELYRQSKRKEFEDTIRRVKNNMGAWIKYAEWETSQYEFTRARNIYERSFDVDYQNEAMWLKYIEMEQKNKFPNHARNLFDRVVQLLPRCDKFWYKYVHMEELLGFIDNARAVFERWVKWEPPVEAWTSYINLEIRHKNYLNARNIYERLIICHPYVSTYLQYAAFEGRQQGLEGIANSRAIFERCAEDLSIEYMDASYFIKFAAFEEKCKELDRARLIYQKGLELIPKHLAEDLYKKYISFEKQFGDKDEIENVILQKRRLQYENDIKDNPFNYDVWFDYARLEESNGNNDKIRDLYERSIANIPPVAVKDAWRRYIYLWINYALFEELIAKDMKRTAQVYEECLKIIPHDIFTFGKIWIMSAHFYIRDGNVDRARKLLGVALGKCPKKCIFKGYIELEQTLGEIDRCRKLYERFLTVFPDCSYAWFSYAAMEINVEETERARALYEMSIEQDPIDDPDALWKNYIEFETLHGSPSLVRTLYSRLLEKTKHVKVWISRAQFESTQDSSKARELFKEADSYFKIQMEESSKDSTQDAYSVVSKEERVLILESWRDFERKYGNNDTLKAVLDRMPKRIKKKRMLKNPDDSDAGWEEFYDYIFPDEAKGQSNLKLLENVKKWKKQKQSQSTDSATAPVDN